MSEQDLADLIEARIRILQSESHGYGLMMQAAYRQACDDCLAVVRDPLRPLRD